MMRDYFRRFEAIIERSILVLIFGLAWLSLSLSVGGFGPQGLARRLPTAKRTETQVKSPLEFLLSSNDNLSLSASVASQWPEQRNR
jgi:hypothetical protein